MCMLLIFGGWAAIYTIVTRNSPEYVCPNAANNICTYTVRCSPLEREDIARTCVHTFSEAQYELIAIWRCKASADNIVEWVQCEELESQYWRSK